MAARWVRKVAAIPDGAGRIAVVADTHSQLHPATLGLLAKFAQTQSCTLATLATWLCFPTWRGSRCKDKAPPGRERSGLRYDTRPAFFTRWPVSDEVVRRPDHANENRTIRTGRGEISR